MNHFVKLIQIIPIVLLDRFFLQYKLGFNDDIIFLQ